MYLLRIYLLALCYHFEIKESGNPINILACEIHGANEPANLSGDRIIKCMEDWEVDLYVVED